MYDNGNSEYWAIRGFPFFFHNSEVLAAVTVREKCCSMLGEDGRNEKRRGADPVT
jgi:hypothetical protein